MAMAAVLLGLAGDRVSIQQGESISKSFPEFYSVMQSLGGRIKLL
jgi:5-enolpyruvylshikimate-3-phosphate synthase